MANRTKAQKKLSKMTHRVLCKAYAKLHESGEGFEARELVLNGKLVQFRSDAHLPGEVGYIRVAAL
jgi:hypothetical protein